MHFQCVFHNTDDADNPCKDAAAKNDKDGKVGKVHMKEFTNGSDDGNVPPKDEEHGGARNPRQDHGTDGNHGTDEDIKA